MVMAGGGVATACEQLGEQIKAIAGHLLQAKPADLRIAGGQVYGASNKYGEYPISKPVRPEELAATIYHALGIPLGGPQSNSGISRPLTTGKPVMELFG